MPGTASPHLFGAGEGKTYCRFGVWPATYLGLLSKAHSPSFWALGQFVMQKVMGYALYMGAKRNRVYKQAAYNNGRMSSKAFDIPCTV